MEKGNNTIEEGRKYKYQYLVDVLVAKGYQAESASKVVEDVTDAMKATRLERLDKYQNKRVLIEVGELHIEAFVHDVKVTEEGILFQVKPVAGDKAIWVRHFVKEL